MSINKPDLSFCQERTDYILSPCGMVAEGLAGMIVDGSQNSVWLKPQDQTILSISTVNIRQIIVFLPDEPLGLLSVLREAASLLNHAKKPLKMLILSRSPTEWLWQTLSYQVEDYRLLSAVQAVSSDLPWRCLMELLKGGISDYPFLKTISNIEALAYGKQNSGLSKLELSTTISLLNGYSITLEAQIRGVSQKTLYNQRTSGLKKMVESHPHFASLFPGNHSKRKDNQSVNKIPNFDREFIHAIHCRKIYPVFQPITDENLSIHGIELLINWSKNGVILTSDEFLPQLETEYPWLLLSAFLLQEAVQNINRHYGKFYFSINIPSCIANHKNFPYMMETAKRQLINPMWADRLILEIPDSIDLQQKKKVVENIEKILSKGFVIFLDHCFSKHSELFPLRKLCFSGYKLDIDIINRFSHDSNALAFLKTLLYYCQLTNNYCIAEGVDSQEKFFQLKMLGVNHFQGDFISPCIREEELLTLIQKLSSDK